MHEATDDAMARGEALAHHPFLVRDQQHGIERRVDEISKGSTSERAHLDALVRFVPSRVHLQDVVLVHAKRAAHRHAERDDEQSIDNPLRLALIVGLAIHVSQGALAGLSLPVRAAE